MEAPGDGLLGRLRFFGETREIWANFLLTCFMSSYDRMVSKNISVRFICRSMLVHR